MEPLRKGDGCLRGPTLLRVARELVSREPSIRVKAESIVGFRTKESFWRMLRPTILIALLSVTVGCSYRREEVTFRNGAVSLAGTLTLPSGNKPHPAVVFIHGSGPDSRENYSFYAELLRVTVSPPSFMTNVVLARPQETGAEFILGI